MSERINESPWYAIQVDKSTNVDNRATMLVFVLYIFQEDVHKDMQCALLLLTSTTAAELLKSLNDYISGKLKIVTACQYMHRWSGCHDWTAFWMVSLLWAKGSLLNMSLCTVSSIEKCWLAKNWPRS